MKYFAIVLFAILIPLVCKAQVELNSHSTNIQTPPIIPCNPNTFWAVHYDPNGAFTANISEFTLTNSTISYNGIVATGCPGMSLAYANYNLAIGNGGTFYSIDYIQNHQIFMYDGSSWMPFGNPGPGNYHVLAGFGNKLAAIDFWQNTSELKLVIDYNGIQFDTIYNSGNDTSIATQSFTYDSNFNIWFINGPDPWGTPATTLCKIDTAGNIKAEYPLSLNSQYFSALTGCLFISNNTLYVYFGANHPTYPSTLMPFNIINDSLEMGTPIPFTFPDVYDIKSCNQGTLTSISEVPESLKELSVYPNPARDQFMLHLPYRTSPEATVQVFNLQGEVIYTQKAGELSPINCSSWPRGIYFVSLLEKGKVTITKKVVVM